MQLWFRRTICRLLNCQFSSNANEKLQKLIFDQSTQEDRLSDAILDNHKRKQLLIDEQLNLISKNDDISYNDIAEQKVQLINRLQLLRKEELQLKLNKKRFTQEKSKQISEEFEKMYLKHPQFNMENKSSNVKDDEKIKQKETTKQATQVKEKERSQTQQKSSQKSQTIDLGAIPKRLSIRLLKAGNSKNQVIMYGVDRNSIEHASYINDTIHTLRPQMVLTQLSPDLPLFIRTEYDYRESWKEFVTGNQEGQFYLSPSPSTFVRSPPLLSKISQDLPNSRWIVYLSERRYYWKKIYMQSFVIDVFKTPLLYSYNNPEANIPVAAFGYPEIKYRDMLAKTVKFDTLYELYRQKQDALRNGQVNFDPFLLKSEQLIKPKIQYEMSIIRKSFDTYSRTMCIVNNNCIDHMEEEWVNQDWNSQVDNLSALLANHENDKISVEQYIKNLVVLDLLSFPFIQNNFARYKVIPMLTKDIMSLRQFKDQQGLLWIHWRNKIKGGNLSNQEMDERINFVKEFSNQGDV